MSQAGQKNIYTALLQEEKDVLECEPYSITSRFIGSFGEEGMQLPLTAIHGA